MYTLRQYLTSLHDSRGLTRTLGEIDVCRDEQGSMCYSAGNSAAVFRIRHQGRIRSLRCYMRPMRHLAEIYGDGYLPRELYLYTSPESGLWVDAVLGDWIEGTTLQEAIATAAADRDTERLKALSDSFDRMAVQMLCDDRAHGDLKPENIVVATDGRLHPIDLDATFLPAFAGETSPELGTAAFQHPARTAADFDAALDDYPAALISTALHALALDPRLYDRYEEADGLLFCPQRIHTDPALCEALTLFEHAGDATAYRIARLLFSPTYRLPQAAGLLTHRIGLLEQYTCSLTPSVTANPSSATRASENPPPELFVENGLWGYRTANKITIPPLYDSGFDFTEGLAAVRLGATWHYIDTSGRIRLSCVGYEAVKPFCRDRAVVIRSGQRLEIDPAGKEFAI